MIAVILRASLVGTFRFAVQHRARGSTTVYLLDNLFQAWQNVLQPGYNVGLAMAIFPLMTWSIN
jgi:hypothetical protein